MLNISEIHLASIIMDAASVLLLIGLIINTSIYRRRGRITDKLFFMLTVATLVMSVSDGITYVLDGSTVPGSALISLFCNDIFFICFEIIVGLVGLYMFHCIRHDDAFTIKYSKLILIPAAASIVMILINHFNPFLYFVDVTTNEYYSYPMYNLVFAAPVLYGIFIFISIIKIDARAVWLYVLIVIMRLYLGTILNGVSSTAVMFTIGLCFIHMHVMRKPFYEEENR